MLLLSTTPLFVGCMAHVGAEGVKVPSDSAQRCEAHCQSIGLELTAVAIMANNVGCVCERPALPSTEPRGIDAEREGIGARRGASSTAGGMVAIEMQREREERQRQNDQQNRYYRY